MRGWRLAVGFYFRYFSLVGIFVALHLTPAQASEFAGASFENGVLDLKDWNQKDPISLVGRFWVFDGELIDPNRLPIDQLTDTRLRQVPDLVIPDFVSGPKHWRRSYVIKMINLPKDIDLGLAQGRNSWSSNSYLLSPGERAKLIVESGHVDQSSPTASYHSWESETGGFFPTLGNEAYLIIHVAVNTYEMENFWRPHIIEPFKIAPAQKVREIEWFRLLQSLFILGLYFLMLINSIALFLQRREDKASLILAFLGVGLILRFLGTEGIFPKVFPRDTSWTFEATGLGLVLGQQLIVFTILQFQNLTFPGYVNKRVLQISNFLFFLSAILFFILKPMQYVLSWPIFTISVGFFGIYATYIFIKTTIRKEESAILGLCGIIMVAVTHIYDASVMTMRLPLPFLGQYGWAGLLFCQSLIVGQRFARTYQRTKILSFELQEKNVELEGKQKQIAKLNDELQEYNEHLEEKVQEKTRDIRSILTHIKQGILAVYSHDGKIHPEHSDFVEELFGTKDIEDKNILDICFANSSLGGDKLDQLKNAIAAAVGQDELAFEANLHAFPSEYQILKNGTTQMLEVDWNPILDDDEIEKLLVVVRDVTELRKLQAEAQARQAEFAMLAEIINVPAEKFGNVIQSSKRLLDTNLSVIEAHDDGEWQASTVDLLFRNMHTFKGLARSYKLQSLTDAIHLAEEKYKDMKENVQFSKQELLDDVVELMEKVAKMDEFNTEKLGRKTLNNDELIQIEKSQVISNLKHLHAIDINSLNTSDQEHLQDVKSLFRKIIYTPLERILHDQISGLAEIAKSLGKLPPKVDFKDPGISIKSKYHELISNVFSHLLRNSIDHGLEKPDVRKAAGKDEAGCLHFDISSQFDSLKIIYFDDGGGLNLPKIYEKAKSKGIASDDKPIRAQDVANLILSAGFSTAEKVSDISGRGVGMDAVKAYVEEENGVFELIIDDPDSLEIKPVRAMFVITLPGGQFENMI